MLINAPLRMWGLNITNICTANNNGTDTLGKFCFATIVIYTFEVEYITFPARKTSKP